MESGTNSGNPGDGKVLNFQDFRNKKQTDDELARGRRPLYVSHKDGKVTGSPHFRRPEAGDFGDRLQRIRTSLEKINQLMSELKKMSSDSGQSQKADHSQRK